MIRLTLPLLSALCLFLAGPALAQNAGVTAAVNQSAKGTPPGGGIRVISLGDNVVMDERIDTDAGGLVQILLADGTTFTVGPNSSLSIDRFVYDPNAGTAEVSASFTRGVFRFIGGRTSKTPDGVEIKTPVGTVGIRGAVADLTVNKKGSQILAQFDLVFGKEMTLKGVEGAQRIYEPGYSIIVGRDGTLKTVKTPPGQASVIQAALAGKPGTSGGAQQKPTNATVEKSQVPETNSEIEVADIGIDPETGEPDLTVIDLLNKLITAPKPIVLAPPTKSFNTFYQGFAGGIATDTTLVAGPGTPVVNKNDVVTVFNLPGSTFTGNLGVKGNGPVNEIAVNFGATSNFTNDNVFSASASNANVQADMTGALAPSAPGTASVNSGRATPGFDLCTCAFLQWGSWTASGTLAGPQNFAGQGYWVTGSIMDSTHSPTLGNATFAGNAAGSVAEAAGTRNATGNFTINYDFGAGTAAFDLTFDGRNYTPITLNRLLAPNLQRYTRNAAATNDGVRNYTMSVDSAFIYGTAAPAVGAVIGNFVIDETLGANYNAAGIFAGTP